MKKLSRGQLKEFVQGSVEETLRELLEMEAEKLIQAARYERNDSAKVTAAATTAVTSPPLPGMSPPRCLSLKESPLKPPLLSGIAAGKAVWKRLLLRCTWQAYPSVRGGYYRSAVGQQGLSLHHQ